LLGLLNLLIMSGRGDKNKHGSSGRGMTNQSNQPFGENDSQQKVNHGGQTGGKRSEPQKKQADKAAHRGSGSSTERRS
jgi:hypothetical protein